MKHCAFILVSSDEDTKVQFYGTDIHIVTVKWFGARLAKESIANGEPIANSIQEKNFLQVLQGPGNNKYSSILI